MLAARDLDKSFGGIHAVQGFNLSVHDRTLHALIGPNGAGKTTAFNVLSGLYRPERGTVELDGRSIAGLKPEDITSAGVGRSFQITNLFGGLSVEGKYPSCRSSPLAHSLRDVAFNRFNRRCQCRDRGTSRLSRSCRHRASAEASSLSYGGQRLLDMGLCLGNAPANSFCWMNRWPDLQSPNANGSRNSSK